MITDRPRITDEMAQQASFNRGRIDGMGIIGHGKYELFDEHMLLKQSGFFSNLVTQVGDQFYGDRAAGILGSTVPVTAITNATSAVCTTTGSHLFTVGDPVVLAGITPSGYNGSWVISAVTDATHFTIYVGTALGALSVAGTAKSYSVANVTGMRLGTGSTAVAKTGAGAAIVTYTSGSQRPLDATYPQSSLSGASRRITYQSTWAAGVATVNGLNEVVITIESPLSDVAGTAANTIARALLSPVVNKGANDTLVVTWNNDLLGA